MLHNTRFGHFQWLTLKVSHSDATVLLFNTIKHNLILALICVIPSIHINSLE